jgi:hypothetical protein
MTPLLPILEGKTIPWRVDAVVMPTPAGQINARTVDVTG